MLPPVAVGCTSPCNASDQKRNGACKRRREEVPERSHLPGEMVNLCLHDCNYEQV